MRAAAIHFIECFQDLLGARPHGNILREVDPTNYASRIDEKFGRPGNVRALRSAAGMEEIVTANHSGVWIGKKSKRVAELLPMAAVDLRGINTHSHNPNAARLELRQLLLETPQLGVAERSPKPAIEDQQHRSSLRRRSVRNGRYQRSASETS